MESIALVSAIPFQNAGKSIMFLFNSFLEDSEIATQRYPLMESTLVKANGVLFMHSSIFDYTSLMDQLCFILDNHIGSGHRNIQDTRSRNCVEFVCCHF
jgi:hypothetical protein